MIIDPYRFGQPVTWDPAKTGSGITLSNGNLTATYSSGTYGVMATTSHAATGKYYFEQLWSTVYTGGNSPMGGVVLGTWVYNTGSPTFNVAGAWGIQSSGAYTYGDGSYKGSGVTFANGDVLGVAVDLSAGKIWFAKNNTWILSGDPAAGTNATWTTLPASALYPAVRFSGGGVATARFASADLGYALPSGFSVW